MAPLITVTLPTVSSSFSTWGCFLRVGQSSSGDLPPLYLACGWPLSANGSLFREWRCLQGLRVEDPSGVRKGGSNQCWKWARPAGLGRPAQAHPARLGRPFAPVGPHAFMHFAPSTCTILTMSSSRPRWRFSVHEVRSFTLQSSGMYLVTLRSSPPLEVISSSSWTRTRLRNCSFKLLWILPLCPCFPT
jgi:hypothetical protein